MQLQRPLVRIRDPSTKAITDTVTSNVPDLLSLPATLASSRTTLSLLFRRGQPFPGTPSLTWTINCEHGEIRLVSPSGTSLEVNDYEKPVTIHVHWFEEDRVEDFPWSWDTEQVEVPLMARTVMK